jgi:hypothetical protein
MMIFVFGAPMWLAQRGRRAECRRLGRAAATLVGPILRSDTLRHEVFLRHLFPA